MDEKLNRDDLAVMIRARQVAKKIGLAPDADIKTICEHAGISRKTGYQWTQKFFECSDIDERQSTLELEQLKTENETLKKQLDDVRFENEGRKTAWEIHNVDELLAGKKNTTSKRKRKKR
jgi:transposase-like protein